MLTDYAGRKLEAWDVAFYAERLKQEKLELAEEELRPYFPLPRVLDGLFKLCATLFDLRVAEAPRPDVWHDSVRYYELKRPDGTLIGSFFTDLFARPNKRGGAWMGGCVSRAKLNGQSASADRLPRVQLQRAGGRQAVAAHAHGGHHAVPRVRPRAAPPLDGSRLSVARRHERRCLGRRRAAEPVPRELHVATRGARATSAGTSRRARRCRATRSRR